MSTRYAVAMAVAVLSLASCSDSSEPDNATPTTAVAATDTTTAIDADAGADASTEPDAEVAAQQPQVFELIATEPTPAGPRPLLAWAGVDGAVAYDLIVLDAAGTPYWAWTGEATSVHIGGVENPDAIGAWVFEPLTWIVTARDADGQPLAMSAQAELLP